MDLGLQGRVAVVAAASRGLGFAVARELVAEGCAVVVCARDGDRLERAVAALGAAGGNVRGVVADVSAADGPGSVARAALELHGRVDVLVNNAGGPPAGRFESHDWAAWQAAVDLTLRSAVELTRLLLPGMKERRWGRVINVTSIAAKQPVDNLILSNAIRAAVTGFARTLANECASSGVTVNNILPGYTLTERVDALAEATAAQEGIEASAVRARFESQIPAGRMGEPREFSALAAFLASDRASYITAQSIAVDGGWVRSLL